MTIGDDDTTITIEDLAVLNQTAVARTADVVRQAGRALVLVGAIGMAAFLWFAVRQQQELEDHGFSTMGPVDEVSWVDRIDVLVSPSLYLLWAALVIGAGLVIRLLADAVVALTGGSLSRYHVGDPFPAAADEPPDDQPHAL